MTRRKSISNKNKRLWYIWYKYLRPLRYTLVGGPVVPPINITLPTITGSTLQNGLVTFTPGTWDNPLALLDYSVVRGTISGPIIPYETLLDWTTDVNAPITGVNADDYLWLLERATDPASTGVAVATSAAGLGPMVALTPADASIIGTGGLATAISNVAATYTFPITIADVPNRGLVLLLSCTGSRGAVNPTWNSVSIGGIPMTLLRSDTFSESTSDVWTEMWILWGGSVPVGTKTVTASRSASTTIARSSLAMVAVGNTSATAPLLAASDFKYNNGTDAAAYTFASASTLNKRLVLAFPTGTNQTAINSPVATLIPGSGWSTIIQPWPGVRPSGSLHFGSAMSRVLPTAGAFNIDFTWNDSGALLRRVGVPVIQIAGDNS